MTQQQQTEIVKKHITEAESISSYAIGSVNRLYVPLIAWAPLWILVILRITGWRFGAIYWLMVLAIAIVINTFSSKRFLIAITNEKLYLIGIKRYKMVETSHHSWPLGEVNAYELREKKSTASFKLHTPIKDFTLAFADGKAAREIYQEVQKSDN